MRSGRRALRGAVTASGGSVTLVVVVAVLASVAALGMPAVLGRAIDAVLGRGSAVVPAIFAVAGVLLLVSVLDVAREIVETRSRTRGALGLRIAMIASLLRPARSNDLHTGDAISRVLRGTTETARIGGALGGLAAAVTSSVGGLVALFIIDVWIGLAVLSAAPVMVLAVRWMMARIDASTAVYLRAQADLVSRFVDAITGARTIRASATDRREIERILRPLPALRAAGEATWRAQATGLWQQGVLAPVLQTGTLIIAGIGVAAGRVTPGELLAAGGYVGMATVLLRNEDLWARVARAAGASREVEEVLDGRAAARADRVAAGRGPGRVSLRGVGADGVDGRAALSGVDLDLPAGTWVAVVGRSGSGKSILLALLAGLRMADRGTVLIDGIPVDELADRTSVVACAFEQPYLIGATVAEAVGYADEPRDRASLRAALVLADAAVLVDRLPQGADTPLAELGVSGGEMQRLGLARALCRDCRVLVLDDVMSSVDTVTERRIRMALKRHRPGLTTVSVTHRPAVAAAADLVVWLDGGVVRARGTHVELLADPGYCAVFAPDDGAVT